MEDKRKTPRHLLVMKVMAVSSSGTRYEAELQNVSPERLGLCWVRGGRLPDLKEEIEIEFEQPDGRRPILSCDVEQLSPECNDRPNARSVYLRVHGNGKHAGMDPIDQLIDQFSDAPAPPRDWTPSLGLRRAWNMLNPSDRKSVEKIFGSLQLLRGDAAKVANHLLSDVNCPSMRLLNLLEEILKVDMQHSGDEALQVLMAAFEQYGDEQFLKDIEWDRRINRDRMRPLVSRVLPRDIVEEWVKYPPQQHFTKRDLVDRMLSNKENCLEHFRQAVVAQTANPQLGRTKKAVVWGAPSKDLESCQALGVNGHQLLDILGIPRWTHCDVIEFFYPSSFEGNFFKPHSVHAGVCGLFEPTPENEEFGRTPGIATIPGVREAVHGPLSVAEALQDGAGLRSW